MKFNVTSTKLLANPDETGWVQVHDFTPQESVKIEKRGRLVALISMNKKVAGVRQSLTEELGLGREILARLHEEYFGNLEGEIQERLEWAVVKVTNEFFEKGVVVGLGVVVFPSFGDSIFVVGSVGVRVYLWRDKAVVPLIEGQTQVLSGMGKAVSGDIYIVGTERFFNTYSAHDLEERLASGQPSMFMELMGPLVYGGEVLGDLGLVVVKVDQEIEIEKIKSEEESAFEVEIVSQPGFDLMGKKGVRVRVVGFIDKVLGFMPQQRIVVRNDTVDVETQKRKQQAPLIGFILIIIFGISVIFGLRQRQVNTKRQLEESRIAEVEREFNEAKQLIGLDMGRARQLVLSAREGVMKLKEEGVKNENLESLSAEIARDLGKISGVYEVTSEQYLDLSLIASGFVGDRLDFSSEKMYVLDTAGRRVVSIEIGTKKTKVVAGSDYLNNAYQVAAYENRGFVLSSDGIREVTEGVELLIKPEWESEKVLIKAFAGNIYVVDQKEGMIWRYPGVRLGFSEKQAWFGSGVKPNLSEAISAAIDGSVWVLIKGGRVLKFSLGSQQGFGFSGFSESLDGVVDIYTSEKNKYLYLLDPGKGRVIIFEKNGVYKGEYNSAELSSAREIIVSEEERKLIYLIGEKLYAFELKHLE